MPATIWLLLMVLLGPAPGLETNTLLNKFNTPEECQIERNRIGFDMAAAYPYERDFVIECQVRVPKEPSTQVNYTEVLRGWADTRHPGFAYSLKALKVKKLEVPGDDKNPPKTSMVFQIVLNYVNGKAQSFIVFVGEDDLRVYAWVEVFVPDTDEEPEEEFPQKDAT